MKVVPERTVYLTISVIRNDLFIHGQFAHGPTNTLSAGKMNSVDRSGCCVLNRTSDHAHAIPYRRIGCGGVIHETIRPIDIHKV